MNKPPAGRRQPTTFGATSRAHFGSTPTDEDPYLYQVGFGNRFASEAIPGTLPLARNTPQKCKYDLYSEQLNGTPPVSSRSTLQHVWFYRIHPSVAHGSMRLLQQTGDLEAQFTPANDDIEFVPGTLCWLPFQTPNDEDGAIDFVQGMKTIAGHGDSTTKEGVAIHIYTANASMKQRAFSSHDGDMLIVPQQGRLDIQTELGRMMIRPGEIAVIQAGVRCKVELPDGPVRGYIQEISGTHYELPELGPIGSNGMALPRDFEFPVASFDMDISSWQIVYKLAGQLWTCTQKHTPFDVVAWHGNYIPYKYALEKFVASAVVDKDQSDPTIYTVLTAKSKIPGISITDFMAFTPKWSVTTNSFRPPYYHRNMAAEVMGIVYGKYGGSSRDLRAGGLAFQSSYMPHGETYETFLKATTSKLNPERIGEGVLSIMFHISTHLAVTRYALERTGVLNNPSPTIWDSMKGHFFDHADEINEDLKKMGLDPLGVKPGVPRVPSCN